MVNKVTLLGRLGADPEVRYTQNGTCVMNLRLATNETRKDKETGDKIEETEWHRIVVWGNTAETYAQYLTKGSQIYLEGKIKTDSWQTDTDETRYSTSIVAHTIRMLDSKQQ